MNYTTATTSHAGARRLLMALLAGTVFALTLGTGAGFAQEDPNDPKKEFLGANADLRAFAGGEMQEAAELFFPGTELQLNNLLVASRNDLLTISTNVADLYKLSLADVLKGTNVGLIFYAPQVPDPFIPVEFYLVKAVFDRGDGFFRLPRVELIGKDGSAAAKVPMIAFEGPALDSPDPVHTITLTTNTITYGLSWNSHDKRSVTLLFTLTLAKSGRR